jgi:hypothetical protein
VKKTYVVAGQQPVYGHAPGDSFSADLDPDIEALHLQSGTLELGKGEENDPVKVPCPACVEQELARPPKFDDLSKLQKHYADKHPALVVPDDLPAPAEKEE